MTGSRNRIPIAAGFVVHLPRSTARQAQVRKIMAASPVPLEIAEAVDGSALSEEQVADVTGYALHLPAYPFRLTRGEIGCFLSHRRIWQMIIDRDMPAALVVEDDAELDRHRLGAALALIEEHLCDGDYVRLPAKLRERARMKLAEKGATGLILNSRIGLTTLAQVVTWGAASRLLGATGQFDRPVDTFLQMPWLTGVRMLTASRHGISEVSNRLGGSIIQKPSGGRFPFKREYLRFGYRRKIAKLQDGYDAIQDG